VAQPMPDLDYVHLPTKQIRDLTVMAPFELQSDIRGAENVAKWKQKVNDISSAVSNLVIIVLL